MEERIRKIILQWFENNGRNLPWRESRDPYRIWLSEIILQQTRIEQGMPYYLRFIEKYPDVNALAGADEQEVLKLWQGLGYYSRARNLLYSARTIVQDYNGKFPTDYKSVLSLKGVGEYTAAAITSIAYNKPHAVVDGNVFRVLSRLYDLDVPIDTSRGKKVFSDLANQLLDQKAPGKFNEAMMDFGSIQCSPVPDCPSCPLDHLCRAFSTGRTRELPVKKNKVTTRKRYFNYFFFYNEGGIWLKKREKGDIWENLYDLPLWEDEKKYPSPEKGLDNLLDIIPPHNLLGEKKHILSHQTIFARFYEILPFENMETKLMEFTFVPYSGLKKYPLPKLIEKFLLEQRIIT